ncbi:zinc-binding alcohol dehydrogenase family protein [Mucilaginibacter corticis]|uniref:Zinc-binding alcohol dehydrogenase family protein n=1 Tax=Mucilaginibacter corticis TaxID=2597670 RepID=A0A556MV58_9SPHI|nr:zinc-binding alcohol dehydrogenase family protein [Mucilaginibacter corticis]TSJ43745.1 zinc-binding alcohol dehydrogenase family protein [Mucilaginibacter corticis]
MKTLICKEPGNLVYSDLAIPEPANGNTLLRVRRIGICGTDLHAFGGTQPYFNYPRVLGHELAAEVVTPGGDFKPGDIVTLIPYLNCQTCLACRTGKPNCCANIKVLGVHTDGGMAEYIEVPTRLLLPAQGLSLDELALVEPLAIGAHGIRRAGVQKDEFVLVVGAGPIGLGAMEFARIAGGKVIALDINDQRLNFCKQKLKVDHTINAITDDVVARLQEITGGDMPTVIIDATGSQKAINNAFQYMAHGARFVLIGLQKGDISFSHPEFHKREATLMSSRNATHEDFDHVLSSMKNNLVDPANYITHRVKFDEVAHDFPTWSDPVNGVIKVMVEVS